MTNTTTVEATIKLEVTIPEGMDAEQARERTMRILNSYLAGKNSPLLEDYGVEAWGADTEPIILRSEVE